MPRPGLNLPSLPLSFEKVLLRHLKQHYLKKSFSTTAWNAKDVDYFARGIVALNDAFTENRAGRFRDYFSDPVMRSGYLAYFLPVNAMKVYGILRGRMGEWATGRLGDKAIGRGEEVNHEIRIVDIGAGPLTMSFGFLFQLFETLKQTRDHVSITITAFELNKKILSDGIDLLREFVRESGLQDRVDVKITPVVGDIMRIKLRPVECDYLFLGNFLNESDKRDEQWEMVQKILANFSQGDTKVFFLEPGSKKITRDLQALRDRLIADTSHVVLAPCLHQHQCPLNLTAKADWCNFTQSWQAPQFIRDFDEVTELKKTHLLYSYLFLQNTAQAPQHGTQEFVAISDLMHGMGRFEIVGCGEAGRVRFIRSHRDKSVGNSAFDHLTRGAYFTMPDYVHRGGYELEANVPVRKRDRVEIRHASCVVRRA